MNTIKYLTNEEYQDRLIAAALPLEHGIPHAPDPTHHDTMFAVAVYGSAIFLILFSYLGVIGV